MIELLRRLIGSSPEVSTQSRINTAHPVLQPAPTTRAPAYDSRLVDSLKHDHRDLVELFEQIGVMADARRFNEIPRMLVAFKTRLEAHLISENVRFYNYVENSLRGDEENSQLIRSFRREMNSIARGVVDFVKKYQAVNFTDQVRTMFMSEYRMVGGLLTQRIEREESSLYPLYQPT